MDGSRVIRGAIALTLIASALGETSAQTLTPYLESSGTQHKPRSNLGVSLRGDRLQLRADLALRGIAGDSDASERPPGGKTEVLPNLRSAFSVAKNLHLETRVSFAEWNAGSDATFDTRLRYKKSLNSFVDELDGSLWRSPDGHTKQTLRLGFRQPLGAAGAFAPITLSGAAIFEASQQERASDAARAGTHKVGLETRVTGLMPRYALFDQSVSFKLEKTTGRRSDSAGTLAYDQAWTLRSLTKLGFTLKWLRRADALADRSEPSFDFSWRSRL
jgi:hypothetical protein